MKIGDKVKIKSRSSFYGAGYHNGHIGKIVAFIPPGQDMREIADKMGIKRATLGSAPIAKTVDRWLVELVNGLWHLAKQEKDLQLI